MAGRRVEGLVLVVDDEPVVRRLLAVMLERACYRVIEASNGRAALEQARHAQPQLVITDQAMPVMDGTELIKRLRADVELARVPIILLPAATVGESQADAVLMKPFDEDELIELVKTLTGHSVAEDSDAPAGLDDAAEADSLGEASTSDHGQGDRRRDERTLADRDQTSSDADQTWADHDQDASDRDQAAAEDDQRASDDDVAAGSDPLVHARTTSARARTSADRQLVAQLRDESGSARLLSGEERDRIAEERDRADEEDERVTLALLDATTTVREGGFSALLERVSHYRERAAAARIRAATDRARASQDREVASRDRASMARELEQARADLAIAPADVLLQALTERDAEIGFHMHVVMDLARATAIQLGANEDDVERTRLAALLHDIGKIAIPDEILNKPASLDQAEWALIRLHTVIGERIIEAAPALAPVATIVRSTHERYDGCGYPDRLAGDVIPVIARIVSVCDAYDAMLTTRPYQPACTGEEAVAELRNHSGTQFDPTVVDAFLGSLESRRGPNG